MAPIPPGVFGPGAIVPESATLRPEYAGTIKMRKPEKIPEYDFKSCPKCKKEQTLPKGKQGSAICRNESCVDDLGNRYRFQW